MFVLVILLAYNAPELTLVACNVPVLIAVLTAFVIVLFVPLRVVPTKVPAVTIEAAIFAELTSVVATNVPELIVVLTIFVTVLFVP